MTPVLIRAGSTTVVRVGENTAEARRQAAEAQTSAQRAAFGVGYVYRSSLLASAGAVIGSRSLVSINDTGTHTDPETSATLPNAGVYDYKATYGWVRVDNLDSQWAREAMAEAEAWAEGTLPGGAGTKSSKEHSLDAQGWAAAAAANANGDYAVTGNGEILIDEATAGTTKNIIVSATVYLSRAGGTVVTIPAGTYTYTRTNVNLPLTLYVNTATGNPGAIENAVVPTAGSGVNIPVAFVASLALFTRATGENATISIRHADGTVSRGGVGRLLHGNSVAGAGNALKVDLQAGNIVVASTLYVPWQKASLGYLTIAAGTVAITGFNNANAIQFIYFRPDPTTSTTALIGGQQGARIPSDAVLLGYVFGQKLYPMAGLTSSHPWQLVSSAGATVDLGFSAGTPTQTKDFAMLSLANSIVIHRAANTISNTGTNYLFTEDGLKTVTSGQSIALPNPQSSAMFLQINSSGTLSLATTITAGNYPIAALYGNAATPDDVAALAPYGNLLFTDAAGISKPVLAVPQSRAPTFVPAETRLILPDHMYFITGQAMPIYEESITAAPAEAMHSQINLALVTNKSGDRRPFRYFKGDILVDPADLGSTFRIGFTHREFKGKRHAQTITPHVAPSTALNGQTPSVLWLGDSIIEYGMLPVFHNAMVAKGAAPTYKGTFSVANADTGTGGRGSEARHSWSYRTFVGRDNVSDGPTNITVGTGASTTWSQNPFLRVATGTDKANNPDRCFNWDANSLKRATFAEDGGVGTNYVIFDFANYVANSLSGVAPTHIVIALGENDHLKAGGTYTDAEVRAEMAKALDIIVRSIMAYSTSIKIAVIPGAARGIYNSILTSTANPWLSKYVPGFEQIQTTRRSLAAAFGSSTIDSVAVYPHTSRVWGFAAGATADLSATNKQQEETPGDGIHPPTGTGGTGTLAQAMYCEPVVAWFACKAAGV